jgi:hypothetical protein
MMNTMIEEKGVTFKELEQEIFRFVCDLGVTLTQEILQQYDKYLHDSRDTSELRDKGTRHTSIKTVYGDVPYDRYVYRSRDEYGENHYVYLLDENLKMNRVGLVSENCVELMVSSITEMSYRNCANKVSDMTGLPISHTGVWNIIQTLGEKLENDERELVAANKKQKVKGEKEVPVLFEEADGVWLDLQGKDREKRHFPKAEMKAAIAYDGWKAEGNDRYSLDGKVVTAGFEKASEFQKKREAMIAAEYNLDEVQLRFMNGDGASWIKKTQDKETVFQLDPFHRNQSIRKNLPHAKAIHDVMEMLRENKVAETFAYLEIYRDSLDDDESIKKVEEVISYFRSNRDGLLPYQERGLEIPESPEGLVYRNMGTMENHIWSVIARRVKHNHTSWSIKGGNHLAKILAKKCSGKLYEVTEQLRIPIFEKEKLEEIKGDILQAGQIRKKIGKGYEYPVIGHMAALEGKTSGERGKLLAMAGF